MRRAAGLGQSPIIMPVREASGRGGGGLPRWVVYSHPSDCPDGYIARRWIGLQATLETLTDPMLDALRAAILKAMPGAMRIERQLGDDPAIVEVWL